jgi:hypothetical protein
MKNGNVYVKNSTNGDKFAGETGKLKNKSEIIL